MLLWVNIWPFGYPLMNSLMLDLFILAQSHEVLAITLRLNYWIVNQ